MKLPSYQQLSKAQDEVVNLPISQSCLVTGPPGTGKTVVALHRTHLSAMEKNERTHLVMYGNLLKQYTSKAAATLSVETTVSTFHTFFFEFYQRQFGQKAPTLPGRKYDFDWQRILQRAHAGLQKTPDLHLIVDEAQDLDKNFFMLANQLAARLTIFADENQCMVLRSTIEELRQYSGIPRDRVYRLNKNYRNSLPIAEFAAQFYVGLPTGMPDLPTRIGSKPRMEKHSSLDETIQKIVRYCTANDDKAAGVICPNGKVLKNTRNRLQGKLPEGSVQIYERPDDGRAPAIDFSKPGAYVLLYQSCKGLEFDSVFLPEIQDLEVPDDLSRLRMKLYVACSRAVERLTVSFTGEQPAILGQFDRARGDWAID